MFSDSYKNTGYSIDKVRTPDETLEWVQKRFDAIECPILHEVKRIDKGRLGIPVFVSRYSSEAASVTGTRKQMGKGVSEAQAKASAVMELVERFSLFYYVKKTDHALGHLTEISSPVPLEHMLKAIHWKSCGEAEEIIVNRLTMKWSSCYRPTKKQRYDIPFSWFWPINEYNGSAAGNSLEEAAVQAISEVVERHVCSLITYGKLKTPEIDQSSIRHPDVQDLLQKFKRLGIKVILKDFSLNMGIPTVGAIAWDPSTFPNRSEIVYTAGTAPQPDRAIIRALTEVAQLAGDFDTDGRYLESGLPKFKTLKEASYVLEADGKVSASDLPDVGSENFKHEIEAMAHALENQGMPLYLIDVTHPHLQVPVIYAVIPGNHFRDRTIGIEFPYHVARVAVAESVREARGVLELVEIHFPGRYDTAFYQGYLSEVAGFYSEALEWYEKALQRCPDPLELASIHCHRGSCYNGLGQYEKALEEFNVSEKYNPQLKETYNLKGYSLFKLGRHLEAIEAFEKAISIDPGSAIDYANIGSNLEKLGLKEAARRWYEMALELDPSLEWARDKLANIVNGHSISA